MVFRRQWIIKENEDEEDLFFSFHEFEEVDD